MSTLVIGLDGATFALIDPLARAGYLPTLARLMTEGTRGVLQSWPDTNSAASWSSIITGYNSGRHGIYNFSWGRPSGDRARPTTGADRRKDPFWRLLSAAGQRVGVINVPITYPADHVNGFMLAGMDTPDIGSPGFAYPSDLPDELRRKGLDYVIEATNLRALSRWDPHRLPQPVRRMITARSRTVLHLMQTRAWDALMAVFVAPDRIQHYFWPDGHASVDGPEWAPIRETYRQIDAFLAEALALTDDDTTLLVVSDHGFGPSCYAMQCLNPLFARLGLLGYRQGVDGVKSGLLKNLIVYGRRVIPWSLRHPLSRAFPGLRQQALRAYHFSSIDWRRTRVFAGLKGWEVFINLPPRASEGTVAPEAYHPLREHVREILLSLVDPDSGRPLIRAVRRREELYRGPYLDMAPDLLIDWDFRVVRDGLCYRGAGEPIVIRRPERVPYGAWWKGNHRPRGILIAWGANIRAGLRVEGATVSDIAPTILSLQGHPIPRDMEGRVLSEIFTDERLRHNPVRYADLTGVETPARPTYLDPDEARTVEARLRSLGYIE